MTGFFYQNNNTAIKYTMVVFTMNKAVIRFSSVTYALKAKEIAEKNGGRTTLRKNPNPRKNEGCGYSLVVVGNIEKIINMLTINKVKYIGYEMM